MEEINKDSYVKQCDNFDICKNNTNNLISVKIKLKDSLSLC